MDTFNPIQLKSSDNAVNPRIAVDIGLVVGNMGRSLSFYRDLLGLKVVADVPTSLIGKGHMVQLEHGTSLIKLIQLDETPSKQPNSGIASSLGYRYITLLVSDITEFMTRIDHSVVTTTLSTTQLSNGSIIAMVKDPDGNIIEFVQESQKRIAPKA